MSGGRAGGAGYSFQDEYVCLQLANLIWPGSEPLTEVLWEKKALQLDSVGTVVDVSVDDAILITRSQKLIFVQVKRAESELHWTAANFVRSGVARQFWHQWTALPHGDRRRFVFRLVTSTDVSELRFLISFALNARTIGEFLSEASQKAIAGLRTIIDNLGIPLDGAALEFLKVIDVRQLLDARNDMIVCLRAPYAEPEAVADFLFRIVAESRKPGAGSRASFTREDLLAKLSENGFEPRVNTAFANPVVTAAGAESVVWFKYLVDAQSIHVVSDKANNSNLTGWLVSLLPEMVPNNVGETPITLILGPPPPISAAGTTSGVFRSSTIKPVKLASIDRETDEAVLMWLIYLAFSRGRLETLEGQLEKVPKQFRSRLVALRHKHWPAIPPGPLMAERESQGRITIPPFGSELVYLLVAAHAPPQDILAPIRQAIEVGDYQLLSRRMERVIPLEATLPEPSRAEMRLLWAVAQAASGAHDAAAALLAHLDSTVLSNEARFVGAFYLAQYGHTDKARIWMSGSEISEDRAFALLQRCIMLWVDAIDSGWTTATRSRQSRELSSICQQLVVMNQRPIGLCLSIAQLALQSADTVVARQAVTACNPSSGQFVEHLHLSALVELQDLLTFRVEHPDRDLGESQRAGLTLAEEKLRSALSAAELRGPRSQIPALNHNLGIALYHRGTVTPLPLRLRVFAEAAETLEKASSNDWETVGLTAQAWLNAGKPENALKKLLHVPPEHQGPVFRSNLATYLLLTGKVDEAVRLLIQLLTEQLPHWQTLTNISIVLMVAGQYELALRVLQIIIAETPSASWTVDYLLARAYQHTGDISAAERVFRRLLDKRSFDPKLYREHLNLFKAGSAAALRSLLQKAESVLSSAGEELSPLRSISKKLDECLARYESDVQRYGMGRAVASGTVTQRFALALRGTDDIETTLRALHERLSSSNTWSPHSLVEQFREVARWRVQYLQSEGGEFLGSEGSSTIDWDTIHSAVARLFSNTSAPVLLESLQSGVLSRLSTLSATARDNEGHWLHVMSRQLEREDDTPLLCYRDIRGVEYKGYQYRAVQRVFSQMHGRAVLADEVGLGKTIEAALILTEYRMRRLVKRCLILVPSLSLKDQWSVELMKKFPSLTHDKESLGIHGTKQWKSWDVHSTCIATYNACCSDATRVRTASWDMIIVDEAHHLRNRGSESFKLVARLRSRYLLLLTATPMQQGIEDLYSLALLVRPTLFRSLKRFRAEYKSREDAATVSRLESLLSQIMVRNTIPGVAGDVQTGRREFRNPSVQLSFEELRFYRETIGFVLSRATVHDQLPLSYYILAREASSSPGAALATLERMIQRNDTSAETLITLRKEADSIQNRSKIERLREIVQASAPKKVLVFVEFRESALELGHILSGTVIHGGLSQSERRELLDAFQADPARRLLVATPGMLEGLNLQFCSVLVNFDLPWNPMRIEQRIGRIQRIGQSVDVLEIHSLAASGTIEEEIRDGLVRKVRIFERLLGPMGLALGGHEGWRGLQTRLQSLFRTALDEVDLRARLARFFEEEVEPLVVEVEASHLKTATSWLRPIKRRGSSGGI